MWMETMKFGRLLWLGLFLGLSFQPVVRAGPHGGISRPGKGERILGLETCRLNGEEVKLLLRRGFLVTNERARTMADLYEIRHPRDLFPPLVTIDSLEVPVFRAVSLVFRASWAEEGEARRKALEEWTRRLLALGPGAWPGAWKKALALLLVSSRLLSRPGLLEDSLIPAGVVRLVRWEERNFQALQERTSPILGKWVDYSMFPRSLEGRGIPAFLAEKWLKTAKLKWWLSEAILLLDRPEPWKASLLLAATAPEEWKELDQRDQALAGPLDNLGLQDYQEAMKAAGGLKALQADPEALEKLRRSLEARPVPGRQWFQGAGHSSRGEILPARAGKGLNLGGSRFSPGIDALEAGIRGRYAHPTGLILAGGAGNSWARKRAENYRIRFFWGGAWRPSLSLGDVDWKAVETCLSVPCSRGNTGVSLFWRFFRAVARDQSGRDGNGEWYWDSPGWKKRRALAALSGWALWRKALGPLGRRGDLVAAAAGGLGGYIVPSRKELQALRALFDFYRKKAPPMEILSEPLGRVEFLLKKVFELREKQESGKPWSAEDERFFFRFSRALRWRGGLEVSSGEDSKGSFSFFAISPGDVFLREPGAGPARPEGKFFCGLAPPRRIYAVVRLLGKWGIARGGLLDYREFLVPPGVEFTDSDWADTLRARPEAGSLERAKGEGHGGGGWEEDLKEALKGKNLAFLRVLLLGKKGREKRLEEVLAGFLEKERRRCRDRWRVAVTGPEFRPPGLPGLLFALQLLWQGRADFALLPAGRRKEFCRKLAREAGKAGTLPVSFLRELFCLGPEWFDAGLRAWIQGKKALSAEEAARILLEFLVYPGVDGSEREERRRRDLADLVVRAGKGGMKTLFLRDLSLGWSPSESVNAHRALLWAFCPQGFKLEDWVLEKAPSSLLAALRDLDNRLKGVWIPPESVRYLLGRLKDRVREGRAFFGIFCFLERSGVFPGPELWKKGWGFLESRLSGPGLSAQDVGEDPFYQWSCWTFCLALGKPGLFVEKFRALVEGGSEEERAFLWKLLKRGLTQVTNKYDKRIEVNPFFSLLEPGMEVWKDLPGAPEIPERGKDMDWAALKRWLEDLSRRVPRRSFPKAGSRGEMQGEM